MHTQKIDMTDTCTQNVMRVGTCFFCLKAGAGTVGREPCFSCANNMLRGVIILSSDVGRTKDPMNPFRTGGWGLATEDALRRMFRDPELVDRVLGLRYLFIDDTLWDQFGLPRCPMSLEQNGSRT